MNLSNYSIRESIRQLLQEKAQMRKDCSEIKLDGALAVGKARDKLELALFGIYYSMLQLEQAGRLRPGSRLQQYFDRLVDYCKHMEQMQEALKQNELADALAVTEVLKMDSLCDDFRVQMVFCEEKYCSPRPKASDNVMKTLVTENSKALRICPHYHYGRILKFPYPPVSVSVPYPSSSFFPIPLIKLILYIYIVIVR